MCPRSSESACYFSRSDEDPVCDDPRLSKCDNATDIPASVKTQTMVPQSSQIAAVVMAQAQCVSPRKWKRNLTKTECHANGPDGKPATQGHCIAYYDCRADKVLVGKEWVTPKVQVAGVNQGSSATPANANTASPAPKAPTVTTPAGPDNPLAGHTPPASGATGQSAVQPNNQTFSQIRAEGARTGAVPGQTGQQTIPGQPQTVLNPATTRPDAIYRPPGYVPPAAAPVSTPLQPGSSMQGLPRAQTTFGNPGFPSSRGKGGRVAGSFISGFASLIGGLFSVPANSVVNYVQSFVGGAPQQAPTTTAQPQTSPQGQVIVVVPYPMPTSSTSYKLPPPPTTADIYAQIRALANEENGISGAPIPVGVQNDLVSSAFTQPEAGGQSGAAPAGNANANSRADAAVTARPRIDFNTDGEVRTTSDGVTADRATSTHATSTSYREPMVVEVGIPVDITDPASYESIIAYLSGDWANVKRTALQNKLALAQAESQQESIRAQIEALQDARAADICDDSCAASLSMLRNELPIMQSRVDALQATVKKDAAPRLSSPPPTVAQLPRIAESLAEPTYQASMPRSASAPPSAVSVAEQEAVPEVPQTKGEAIVTRVVESIWDFLKSWFLPPTTQGAQPRPSCSLFASLFGKCK